MRASSYLPQVARTLGVDRPIIYAVLGRGWSVLAGPITILLVATFLSIEEQGFYYTFANVLGLQIFFELGLSLVVLQFASHEKAKLEWTIRGVLEGDPTAKARLSSLLRRALAWYSVAAAAVIAVVLPSGLLFFGRHQPVGAAIVWHLPWVWLVVTSACGLLLSPVLAVIEGCGLVAEIALLRIFQGITGSVLSWLVLSQHGGLFAAPVPNTVGFLCALGWLAWRKRAFLSDLLVFRHNEEAIDWQREVWPFQWRIALSGVSGYFIFLLFSPVLFAFHGAVAAGRMGMSMSVMGAIAAVALAWVTTKMAVFGTLIAKGQFRELDRIFFHALWWSGGLITLGGVTFEVVALYLHSVHHPFSQRILDPLPLGLLIATTILNHIVGTEAVYLRAHKQEPYLGISILNGCLVGLSTYVLGRHFGATGMMSGYFLISLFAGLGAGTWIFIQKRRLWHTTSSTSIRATGGPREGDPPRHVKERA